MTEGEQREALTNTQNNGKSKELSDNLTRRVEDLHKVERSLIKMCHHFASV